jgi:hypothetical protein
MFHISSPVLMRVVLVGLAVGGIARRARPEGTGGVAGMAGVFELTIMLSFAATIIAAVLLRK